MRRLGVWATFVVLLCSACRNSNEVASSKLAPRLLHDEADMTRYLAAFPANKYKVVNVKGVGKFYLDDINDAIKNVLRSGQPWEAHINKEVSARTQPGTTAIDAGAHIGSHTLVMARAVGSDGRVYAFEPQKKIFRELVNNLKLNDATNVIALRFALGSQPAVIEMGPKSAGNEGGVGVGAGGEKAELRTIDSFGFEHVSLIKIDVEGFEDHVIDGASSTIKAQHPVLLVEIMGGNDYDTAAPDIKQRIDQSVNKIKGFGYEVARFSPHDYLATYPKR
jgi:FkbM family methyltransferase